MFYLTNTMDKSTLQSIGKVIFHRMMDDSRQAYFLYVPRCGGEGRPLFVTVHGVQRRARDHAAKFAPLAEQYGVVLVAPLFPEERFSDYQRLGFVGRGPRADLVLNRIIDEVAVLTGADTNSLHLFGYSGGGQFVQRYAMVHPSVPRRIAVAAPGWYTFPDHSRKFPLGIKKVPGWSTVSIDPGRFLTIPTCVLVGAKDTRQDGKLNQSPRIDRQQGGNRLLRAKTWIRAMEKEARARHLTTEFDLQILSGCKHSFIQCMHKGEMGKRVFTFLFGPSANSTVFTEETAYKVAYC